MSCKSTLILFSVVVEEEDLSPWHLTHHGGIYNGSTQLAADGYRLFSEATLLSGLKNFVVANLKD